MPLSWMDHAIYGPFIVHLSSRSPATDCKIHCKILRLATKNWKRIRKIDATNSCDSIEVCDKKIVNHTVDHASQ